MHDGWLGRIYTSQLAGLAGLAVLAVWTYAYGNHPLAVLDLFIESIPRHAAGHNMRKPDTFSYNGRLLPASVRSLLP